MAIIVPIGIDCCIAGLLRKLNIRKEGFPFDWNVTYNGVKEIIEDNFKRFIPNENNINEYNVKFIHDTFPRDIEKYKRKIERFYTALTSDKKIILLRKGHMEHHHNESSTIKCDIKDSYDLDKYISDKYKNLNYTIITIIMCNKCYKKEDYISNSSNIKFYTNINDIIYETNEEYITTIIESIITNY